MNTSPAQAARDWLRRNLFSTWRSTIFTVVFLPLAAFLVYRLLSFIFVDGRWEIVERNIQLILVFRFPEEQLGRIWAVLLLLAVTFGLAAGATRTLRLEQIAEGRAKPLPRYTLLRRVGPLVVVVAALLWMSRSLTGLLYVAIGALVLAGARFLGTRIPRQFGRWPILVAFLSPFAGLAILGSTVPWDEWGGFMLTLALTLVGISASFPIGVLLAFGRRSTLPVIRYFCIGFIEAIRGVPLVALLFMGHFVVQLLLPPDFGQLNPVSKAMVGLTLFTSAYIAEIVRGGIQSVPDGQVEAAHALGLSHYKTVRLILLPQALRNVIPALVGQFISLFKDTSLVVIIGMTELLGVARIITNQRDFVFQGYLIETLSFAALVYWVVSYTMSRESRRLEQRLGVGER